MSYGFSIKTGTGSVVDLVSSDNVPGVYVDSFFVTYSAGSSVSRTYSSFPGTQLLATLSPVVGVATAISISINNLTKTITVTCNSVSDPNLRQNANVVVMGL
jgi:hypothetical protein